MSYLYGHRSKENKALQRELAILGTYKGEIDGIHLGKTRDAVIATQMAFGINPADGVVRGDLLSFLGLVEPPAPHANPLQDFFTGLVIKTVLNKLKGSPMFSFLEGYRTYIVGTLMILTGAAGLVGIHLPGVTLDPADALKMIGDGFGFIFLRGGVKALAAK